ncbi:hypothetical protein RMSM_05142 [Rhodopirellula maiorica SM1]|uniref:Uncharacterized protein n=2 Tax=Novipirellula TaxID=2795426 RepID=M5REZ7_9BACT|nr:hypothetical protein RMSM_05142 [Rhodopirellula maiorica SM1]
MYEDWLAPCSEARCPEIHQEPVFKEAVSAGVVEMQDENRQIWKWKRPWLCEFFAKGVSLNVL